MARNDVYEIEVINWEKHKGSLKRNHSYFMLSKRFFDDHKIATLTPIERLLFITMIARCADEYASTIRPTHDQLATMCGLHRHDIATSIRSLEENQLVKVLKWPPNTKEKKRKEEKRNSVRVIKQKEPAAADTASPVPIGKTLIATYCEVFKSRYGTNPVIRPQDAKSLKAFGESVGVEKAKSLLAGYLAMSNSWFIIKAHDLTTFLQNLNQVQNFIETGQVVTLQDARNAENADSLKNQIARLTGSAS